MRSGNSSLHTSRSQPEKNPSETMSRERKRCCYKIPGGTRIGSILHRSRTEIRSSSWIRNSPPIRYATSSSVPIIFRIFFGEKERASAADFVVSSFTPVPPREDQGMDTRQETVETLLSGGGSARTDPDQTRCAHSTRCRIWSEPGTSLTGRDGKGFHASISLIRFIA